MTEASVLYSLVINSQINEYLDELKDHINSDIYWNRKQLLQAEKKILAEQLDSLSDLKQYLK